MWGIKLFADNKIFSIQLSHCDSADLTDQTYCSNFVTMTRKKNSNQLQMLTCFGYLKKWGEF